MRLGHANENGTPLFGVNAIPVFGQPAAVAAESASSTAPTSDDARAAARGSLRVGDLVTVVAYQP